MLARLNAGGSLRLPPVFNRASIVLDQSLRFCKNQRFYTIPSFPLS